ncbi:MAG: hypothetical protein RJB18_1437, partial [Pseudomonadota bacterium]
QAAMKTGSFVLRFTRLFTRLHYLHSLTY